ncbi:MAG: efflux RND transporter permease subunit [Deltaproteobacteria bacterium]|nr:efflux RND transporter permease subunit [Deltaproteobacteria bacterium]
MTVGAFSVKNPVFVNLVLLLFVVLGITSFRSMPREVFPSVPLDMVTVTTVYPGVSPEEIEKIITIPEENALQGVDGINEIDSQSREGMSLILAKVDQDRDLKKVSQDMESALNRMDPLPDDAKSPVVQEIETRYPVINISVYGNTSEDVRREISDELEDRILEIPGVGEVLKSGYRDREIWVEVDPHRLDAYHLPISEVVLALKRRNLNLPAGILKGIRQEFLIRTVGEFRSTKEILDTVIRKGTDGGMVRIRDVADVKNTFEEASRFGRSNGARAITLIVTKQARGDTIKIADAVKKLKSDLESHLPAGAHLSLSQDNSQWIRNRLHTLYVNGSIGFILVCTILFLTLNWRIALFTALGIPFSFLGAFTFMKFFGMTINMLTLFSLIVVLGIVVDDAIIIAENVFRHLAMGKSPSRAAIEGTNEVVTPVFAAVSTTIAAFLPMLMMTGILGKFMRVIPIVVNFALIASLVEALLTLPSHLADFAPSTSRTRPLFGSGKRFRSYKRRFARALGWLLRRRYKVLLSLLLVTIVTGLIARYEIPFVLFDTNDIPSFIVQIETPEGSPLIRTEAVIARIEKRLLRFPKNEITTLSSLVGSHFDPSSGRTQTGTQLGQVMVELPQFNAENRVNGYQVLEKARRALRGISGIKKMEFVKIQAGPPVGKAVEVRIRGKELPVLRRLSGKIQAYLKTLPGTRDIQDDLEGGKKELIVRVDEKKAALFGIHVEDVALALKSYYGGIKTSEIHRKKDQIDVIVRMAPKFRSDYTLIKTLKVANASGELIPLSMVTKRSLQEGSGVIRRKDQRRTITVTADVDTGITTSSAVKKKIEKQFGTLAGTYPGYSFAFAGEQKEQMESVQSLIDAFLISIITIYIILGTLFRSFIQPFVVMIAVPFAFIGVIIGHLVMGISFGLLSMIGMVAMVGIVVNDSLVLLDFINKSRSAGMSRWRSIITATETRFRPIILTSLTTIAGVSTLAFQRTGQAAFLAPMALSIFWGLTFSTILTLVIVPCFFAVVEDVQIWIRKKLGITVDWAAREKERAKL